MARGTSEGTAEEIDFVKQFNRNKLNFKNYLSNFEYSIDKLWLTRVTTQQFSELSQQKVYTRADCYLVYIDIDITNLLQENDYYISEDDLHNTNHTKIQNSGISIKMHDSKSFQILKLTPNSFNSLLGCYELGAGASLFCLKDIELPKNIDLLNGWKTTTQNMVRYFADIGLSEDFHLQKDVCKKIKNFSCSEIERLILSNQDIKQKVFNGIGLYEEPYTAWYFSKIDTIESLEYIPFSVTTGSGRSKGDYTIVLKPKRK